jgi:hypothetical protein
MTRFKCRIIDQFLDSSLSLTKVASNQYLVPGRSGWLVPKKFFFDGFRDSLIVKLMTFNKKKAMIF